MADRSITYRLLPGLQGGRTTVARGVDVESSYPGVVGDATDVETALRRIDGTGAGSRIRTFTGSFTAQLSNIDDWFGNRQQTTQRCTSNAGLTSVTYRLPGTAALTAAFDRLQALGVEEVYRLRLEYTGPSSAFVRVVPRDSTHPQIGGATAVIIRTGTFAVFEIARISGVIGDFVFQDQAAIGDTGGSVLDAVKFISPETEVWDASEGGPLPNVATAVYGNAYRVVNAPSDQSGRFGEVMSNGDRVVVEVEQISDWAATPRQWGVLPLHEVRRITALQQNFLSDISIVSPVTGRNRVLRGANYADTAGELRIKVYPDETGANAYTPADLNTNGDIDEYVNPTNITGILAIRLDHESTSLTTPLTDLYVYADNAGGRGTLIGNLARDFAFRGDFSGESDYTSNVTVTYTAGQTIRVYVAETIDRFDAPDLDVSYEMLTPGVQQMITNRDTGGVSDEHRLATLESKMSALYPLTPDVTDLTEFAGIFSPGQSSEIVDVTTGYSLMADYRGDSTRYEQTGVVYDNSGTNVVRYSGLTNDYRRAFGFKVTAPSDKTLLSLVDGTEVIPYIDMTAAGNFRVNNYRVGTSPGANVRDEIHFLTRSSGVETLLPGEGTVSTFLVTPYPSGSTARSRTLQIDLESNDANGNPRQSGHLATINLPAENVAQPRRTLVEPVPIAFGNVPNVTISYETRVVGSDFFVDIRLVSSDSAEISGIRLTNVAARLTYTAASTTTRTDRWIAFTTISANPYVFSGEAELLVSFQPFFDGNITSIVGVVRESDGNVVQLNDDRSLIPNIATVEIPDDIDFRTLLADHYFIHRDLAHLITRTNTQWVYGLALLREISEYSITGELDFTSFVMVTPNGRRFRVTMTNAGAFNITVIP